MSRKLPSLSAPGGLPKLEELARQAAADEPASERPARPQREATIAVAAVPPPRPKPRPQARPQATIAAAVVPPAARAPSARRQPKRRASVEPTIAAPVIPVPEPAPKRQRAARPSHQETIAAQAIPLEPSRHTVVAPAIPVAGHTMISTDAVRSGLTQVHQAVSADSVADGIQIDIEESRAAMSTDAVLPRRSPAAFGETVLHSTQASPTRIWLMAGTAALLFVVGLVAGTALLG